MIFALIIHGEKTETKKSPTLLWRSSSWDARILGMKES
jgi:hypothetical protein